MAGYSPFDPRGLQLAPQYTGPFAATGTIYNPAGAAGAPAPVRPSSAPRPQNPVLSMLGGQQQQKPYSAPNPFTMTGGAYDVQGSPAYNRAQAAQPQQQQGGMNINTSINPQNIYSPQQSQYAANQAQASSVIPLPWLQGRYAGNGMSVNSPGVTSQVLPQYAQGQLAGLNASAMIPFQDTVANAQHQTAGQQGREGEAIDWARLASSADSTNRNFQMNSLQSLLSLLGGFM